MFNSKIVSNIILAVAFVFTACSNSTTGADETPVSEIEIKTVENLYAPFDRENPDSTPFVYFNLRTGETVHTAEAETDNWDIGFRGTQIIVNSGTSGPGNAGALMLDVPFDDVIIAPSEGYLQDSVDEPAITGSGGWYTYTGNGNPPRAVISHDDTTIIFITADGNHFAKLNIMSYYEGNPDYGTEEFANFQTRPASQHFTFKYAIQLAEGLRELK